MRKLIRIIPALIGLTFLTGTFAACGSSSGSASPPSVAASVQDSPQSYLSNLESRSNDFGAVESQYPGLLLKEGQGACGDFAQGFTLDQVIVDADNAQSQAASYGISLSQQDFYFIVGAAVKDLCPEYRGTVEAQLNAAGATST